MTGIDISRLLALREQATGGEWRQGEYDPRMILSPGGWVSHVHSPADVALIVAAVNALPELVAKAREADRLHQWKAEAIEVIKGWEAVWEALGRPGTLGQSKSAAVLAALSLSDGGDR